MKLPNRDTVTMSTIQKGEILYLNSIGRTKKQIAKATDRSMSWVEDVISALAGTKAREDLIAEYQKGSKKNDKK